MGRIIIAADAFKDSLAAIGVCVAIARGVERAAPDWTTEQIPLADGGEGTAQILALNTGAEWRTATVRDPLFRPVQAGFGWLASERTAFVDMASCAGLMLLEPAERNPLHTTTAGLGDLLREIARLEPARVVIGIGGSATNDAGLGMASVLGYDFLDVQGRSLSPVGSALDQVVRIVPPAEPVLGPQTRIEVLVDVQNPLFGPAGAAHVFAPQKGATLAAVARLDAGLANIARRIASDLGKDIGEQPGAGAAGGLGGGLQAFLGGTLQPGIQTILELIDFERRIAGADLILTGEGKLDGQTAGGKLISGVAAAARSAGIPVVALCGTLAADSSHLRAIGLDAAFSILDGPQSLSSALERTSELLALTAAEVIRLFRLNHPAT